MQVVYSRYRELDGEAKEKWRVPTCTLANSCNRMTLERTMKNVRNLVPRKRRMIVRCICGKNLRVPDQYKGKKIRCPSCGETFVAPTTSSVAAPAPTRPKIDAPAPSQVEDKSVKKSPKATGREPRSSSVLLAASGGLGVVALLGFIASGVLFVLGLNATPTYRPIVVPHQPKADQTAGGKMAPKQPAPAARQPPPEKAKDEVCRFSNLHASGFSIRSDDRQVLIASGGDLLVGDLEKGSILRSFPRDHRQFTSAQFLPDGKQALVSRLDNTIEVLDLETGKVVHSFAAKTRLVLPLAVSADGQRVIGGGDFEKHFLHQWDVASGRESARTDELPSYAQKISSSADGKRVLLDCRYLPFVWDIDKGGKVRRLSPRPTPISTIWHCLRTVGARCSSRGNASCCGTWTAMRRSPTSIRSGYLSTWPSRRMAGGRWSPVLGSSLATAGTNRRAAVSGSTISTVERRFAALTVTSVASLTWPSRTMGGGLFPTPMTTVPCACGSCRPPKRTPRNKRVQLSFFPPLLRVPGSIFCSRNRAIANKRM